jgi:hypothetical protein
MKKEKQPSRNPHSHNQDPPEEEDSSKKLTGVVVGHR